MVFKTTGLRSLLMSFFFNFDKNTPNLQKKFHFSFLLISPAKVHCFQNQPKLVNPELNMVVFHTITPTFAAKKILDFIIAFSFQRFFKENI